MIDSNQNSGDFVDMNNKWGYPIQWLYESRFARDAYRVLLYRSALAKEGLPSKNLYQEKMTNNVRRIKDKEKQTKFLDMCACLPIGRSFALANAVDNRANQLAGGVDTYECEVNDPYMVIDDQTEDLLAAKCEQDYAESNIKYMASQFSDDLTWAGVAAVLVKYCPETGKNRVFRLNPKNIWFDTKYSATGEERFRGYSTMISFDCLLHILEEDGDEINPYLMAPEHSIFGEDGKIDKKATFSKGHIDTVNGLKIYVEDLNKLAASTSLQGNIYNEWNEYTHDLSCYNFGWYKTMATDPEARTKSGYNGDDVELTVIYDLAKKREFKIINRRYVISVNEKAFKRVIPYEIINPVTQTIKITEEEFHAGCPLIFKFEHRNMDLKPFPVAPVFALLDEHDELCSLIAKRKHVTDIISLLRIRANSSDADSLEGTLNINGVILDDIQGEIEAINLANQYNYEPLDAEINRMENVIKTRLKGYDDFDAMQAMGDRASAAESGMATGAIAQGLTTLQQTVMSLYADVARVCIGNYVTYSPENNFKVWNGGDYSSLTIQQMATLAIVNVKPKLAKKVQERAAATNALGLIGNLGSSGLINQEGIAYLMEQALFGQMPRGLAAKFVNKPTVTPETVQANAIQAQNMATALQQNERFYLNNPMQYEANDVIQSLTPTEVDEVIAGLASQTNEPTDNAAPIQEDTPTQENIDITETPSQEAGISLGDIGLGSEAAGQIANMGYM